jgi:LmbE family N-acetylglucosaminyl deacetylase
MRLIALQLFRRLLYKRACDISAETVTRSALVFSPHPDDETLGCGGTMLLKRRSGTPVWIAFMTDGATSHNRFMDEDELRHLRQEEALHATQKLGIPSANIKFLNFPDGRLHEYRAAAVQQVLALMELRRPCEVFVPYRRDGTSDHEATNRVVMEALRQYPFPVLLCEYPIWCWNSWPWVPSNSSSGESLHFVKRAAKSGFGFSVLRRFRTGVVVVDVLKLKREALDQHRSQMVALRTGVNWPTLPQVGDGKFLSHFFQDMELFACEQIN